MTAPKPNTTNSEPITSDDLFQGTVLSDNRFSRFDQEIIDKYFNDDGKKAIKAYVDQALTAYKAQVAAAIDHDDPNTWRQQPAWDARKELKAELRRALGLEEE